METPTRSATSSQSKPNSKFISFLAAKPGTTHLHTLRYPGPSSRPDVSVKHENHHHPTMKSFNDNASSTSIPFKQPNIIPTTTRAAERKYIPLIAVKTPLATRQHTLDFNKVNFFHCYPVLLYSHILSFINLTLIESYSQ